MKRFGMVVSCVVTMLVAGAVAGEKTADELTQESIEKCKETAEVKATPEMIVEKVEDACDLIKEQGEACFPAFRGKDSEFLFAGTYLWVHTLPESIMQVHPIKPALEGKDNSVFKDPKGRLFIAELNELCKKNGEGWVEYMWPKPGEKKLSPKVTYGKVVEHDGQKYVVCCGSYDVTMDEVTKAKAE